MKHLLYGNSIILLGIVGLLVSWIGEIQALDVIGVLLSATGYILSTYGFFKKTNNS